MIIYKDRLSGDELFSDTYPMKVVDDIFYEVEGKLVTEKTEVNEAMFGGNASAEGGAEEAADDVSQSGCNIVLANRLQEETTFDKKAFQGFIKTYMKKLVDEIAKSNPDRVEPFKASAKIGVKKILDTFKDWQFFYGESGMDGGGMVALMNFREDGVTPYMLFFKDGLVEEKV